MKHQYPLWEDLSPYASTLVVARGHPDADDDNPGTEDAPLLCIQAALDRVMPGQRIRVHTGVYREALAVRRGGEGPEAMISLEAAPGETVVVSGSRVLPGGWIRPRPWEEGFGPQGLTPSFSQRVWRLALDELGEVERRKVLAANVEAVEEALMPWMEPVSGRPPFTLRRGLLFQDGRRLQQLHHAGDLPKLPGSYVFEADGSALLVHPYGSGDPARHRFELAVRPQLLCPDSIGLGYVRLSGLVFEHCANAFLRAGAGAVSTLGGGHWIIEDCRFRGINSAGLEFGDHPFEHGDADPRNPGRGWASEGFVIARRNHFEDCGTAGIRCLGATEARVLDNLIEDCGWQEAEYYFECAGIKLLLTRHTLVAGNLIRHLRGACGIWLDWDNRGSRVTRNHIRDIESIQGGIFVEASHEPNLVDRNLIWNVDGPGIFGGDSSFQLYLHNLIGRVREEPMKLFCHTQRRVNERPVTCVGNRVEGNVFVDPPAHRVDEDDNVFAANVLVRTVCHGGLDVAAWQARGFDADLCECQGTVDLSEDGELRWDWDVDLAGYTSSARDPVDRDVRGRVWPADGSAVGPWPLPGRRGSLSTL
ncbi:MAG: right-handed parallel beta-helix repeat-containing protein [Verrucomicrobia bacterium]|nr:right-handed parallel beta-helix repeat-containing protein [Verrucomicrobiota bacterium]MCH8512256.1 right-handed parallel beta-helix repeat-containing protein [Kiritimatiellia bacterium]